MAFLEKFSGTMPNGGASRTRKILSYAFDYIIIFVLLAGFLALDAIEPYHQEFSLRNYTLQYKYAVHERVPNLLLVVIACLAPAGIIVLWTLVVDGIFSHKVHGQKRKYTFKERLWELNCGLLGLALSIGLQYVIVGSLKNAIGKPRPDLIDRCIPKEGSQDPMPFGLSNHSICTQTNNAILKDGFRSFPSGHSSTSFGGLFYLSLYLAAKLHVLDSRGEVWKLFIVMTPSLGAALVAGSRIMDARHHPFDVLSGSTIGILVAWAAYRQYFPSPSDFNAKGRAYPARTWGMNPLGKRDKEAYGYDVPLEAQDEDTIGLTSSSNYPLNNHPQSSYANASPPPQSSGSGNYFRDEIHASTSARHRTYEPNRKPIPLHTGDIGEAVPGPLRPRGARDGAREDGWEDVTGQASPESYELQPQYSLNQDASYDPYQTDDTSYRGGSERVESERSPDNVTRLPSMRSPAGQKMFPAALTTGQGTAGKGSANQAIPSLVVESEDERGRSTSRKRKEVAS
ncbi:PAP2-domain-containing protein [Microthyrium microscopicum]|uniref:PAP2-domain-containing protein n=1 Tax=Microthyrium microscopicum TaxID=703497 RepID=A0A6A6TYL5_9PEZI|nr:PAP2-domain-containing protein [Microthyrium microscopicum]